MLMTRMLAGCLAVLTLGSASAEAGIVCRDGYQVVNGEEISTPYCGDNYLAEVARLRGFKVTNEAVRNDPGRKDEICRAIGRDIRVSNSCDPDSGPDRGGGR